MLSGLSVNRLGEDALLLVEVVQLLGKLLVLKEVILRLLNRDTIVLSYRVELS